MINKHRPRRTYTYHMWTHYVIVYYECVIFHFSAFSTKIHFDICKFELSPDLWFLFNASYQSKKCVIRFFFARSIYHFVYRQIPCAISRRDAISIGRIIFSEVHYYMCEIDKATLTFARIGYALQYNNNNQCLYIWNRNPIHLSIIITEGSA